MGSRILRESICISPTIERLSWFEEVCFYRLIVQCDDFGRLDARPAFLKSRLVPLRDDVDSATIDQTVRVLEEKGLLCRYEAEGLPYLQLLTWEKHQRVRNRRSKYPSPWPSDEQVADN